MRKSRQLQLKFHAESLDHINMLGRYSFAMPETVARGELRPLRNPAIDQE